MREPDRVALIKVRTGQYSEADCVSWCHELETKLEKLIHTSHLPEKGDTKKVQSWVDCVYMDYWKNDDCQASMGRHE